MVVRHIGTVMMSGFRAGLRVCADVRSSDFLGHAFFDGRTRGDGGELGGGGGVGRLLADAFAVLHEDELKGRTGVRNGLLQSGKDERKRTGRGIMTVAMRAQSVPPHWYPRLVNIWVEYRGKDAASMLRMKPWAEMAEEAYSP